MAFKEINKVIYRPGVSSSTTRGSKYSFNIGSLDQKNWEQEQNVQCHFFFHLLVAFLVERKQTAWCWSKFKEEVLWALFIVRSHWNVCFASVLRPQTKLIRSFFWLIKWVSSSTRCNDLVVVNGLVSHLSLSFSPFSISPQTFRKKISSSFVEQRSGTPNLPLGAFFENCLLRSLNSCVLS